MTLGPSKEQRMDISILRKATQSADAVAGFTHGFYRYPARFSPHFAAESVRLFSRPGDIVVDPFMGGGTTVVESLAAGRRVVGCDLNSLAVFVTRVKTTSLTAKERNAIRDWVREVVAQADYRANVSGLGPLLSDDRTRNLTMPRARAIKKALAIALDAVVQLPSQRSKAFARCVLLKTAQWALDNRKRRTPLEEFRERLVQNATEMLLAIKEFHRDVHQHRFGGTARVLMETDAASLDTSPLFRDARAKAQLVLTSPPYPGIHVLYDRWQVDGRRETPAPYWIADCVDGHGNSFYTFGDRRRSNMDFYFESLRRAFESVRKVMRVGGWLVQMVGFAEKRKHLPWYLNTLECAGFTEVPLGDGPSKRIWRDVPNRKWHANSKGRTSSCREVVLLHRAV